MSSEKIIVYIDQAQLTAQKNNNYSLFLAKKVNGVFTVIWQSMGPVATVGQPSYEYKNTFIIKVPSYQVNYGNVETGSGAVSFSSAGKPVTINTGQSVELDANGVFGAPANNGKSGTVTIHNSLAGNPHEVLTDIKGNPIFFNAASGMDVGEADLTPIDDYQIWFDNYQATGTIIAHNSSHAALVEFASGDVSKTITYQADGTWVEGAPSQALRRRAEAEAVGGGTAVVLAATFTAALTAGAVTYLTRQLISKFAPDLRPTSIKTSVGSFKLEITFQKASVGALEGEGTTRYEQAVETALEAARNDPRSGLAGEVWSLGQPQLEVRH